MTNAISGLKIPLTAIVTKEFYTIPKDFATENDGFWYDGKDDEGRPALVEKKPTIYASILDENATYIATPDKIDEQTMLYVDCSVFPEGTVIYKEGTDEQFVIGETDVLEGVYCVNAGFAVFRRIEVLDQNEEYAIVAKDTGAGLVRYDRIVRDASDIKEKDILY